jgi:hypothetical protein
VAQKDCLAHHRFGSPRMGGDEYPDRLSFLKLFSSLHDRTNVADPGRGRKLLNLVDCNSRKVLRRFTRSLGGSWPGNDTCWRMALDLARIVEHADRNGRLQAERQRLHVMVTDGIVGGEGNGPLSPQPVTLGYLSFADNVAFGDYFNCLAMGFDPRRIPMIANAFRTAPYRLVADGVEPERLHHNGELIGITAFRNRQERKFLPPREWRNAV